MDLSKVPGVIIDEILDEIDNNEKKQNEISLKNMNNNDIAVNWDEIIKAVSNKNISYIKNLITSNDIEINAQNPSNGKTLLIYAVIIGNIDLVEIICNFGADPHINDIDGDDALHYSMKYGQYKITELLYYQQLSGKLGKDLRNIATQIHRKNKEAQLIKECAPTLFDWITYFVQEAIKLRSPFSADLLYYAWYHNLNTNYPLHTDLWSQMMETFNSILRDTSDKKGWKWLKQYFLGSRIWYLPHPNNNNNSNNNDNDNDDDADDMEVVLKNTLFWESKSQSDQLLKDKINEIQTENENEWNDLISYNISTKYTKTARQDFCQCLLPKYTENDLSESKYPPSTHFNAKKHYDNNIYLNEILFRANILDSMFQKENNINVTYRAGPIKTLSRSQTKVENDYINEEYPTSAKILDMNRCALQFQTIKEMIIFLQIRGL